jgi:hypothetical protein
VIFLRAKLVAYGKETTYNDYENPYKNMTKCPLEKAETGD